MFALPCLILAPDGSITFSNGTIIQLPPSLTGKQRNNLYAVAKKPGWSKTIFEYESFTFESDNFVYIFPALYTTTTQPKKKFVEYRKGPSKDQIEKYVKSTFERDEVIKERAEENLTMITHDLRRLSTAIYHQAMELKNSPKTNLDGSLNKEATLVLVNSIIASQTMLRLRTDVLDFRIDSLDVYPDEEIPVHPRVLKVVRCFRPWADHRHIYLDLRGDTFAKIFGPNIFEILIYIILDNALKYSPNSHTISIEIDEGRNNICLLYTSPSPRDQRGSRMPSSA